jgi:hypothetical protein
VNHPATLHEKEKLAGKQQSFLICGRINLVSDLETTGGGSRLLSSLRKRRSFIKFVLWILVIMISIGMLAWFGGMGSISPMPQTPQTQQQGTPGAQQ